MADNETPRIPIGCRYRADRVELLDAVARRLGIVNRADVIRRAVDEFIARHQDEVLVRSTD